MEKLSVWRLALVFPGFFFGAGFVSGQELLQFFGVYGYYGVAALALSIAGFAVLTGMVVTIVHRTGYRAFGDVAIGAGRRLLRGFLSACATLFLAVCVVVMVAGCGSMLRQLTDLPVYIGSGFCCLLLGVIVGLGRRGVINALNTVAPLMAVASAAVCLFSFLRLESAPVQSAFFHGGNPLTGSLPLAALSFLSYNMLPAVSIIISLSGLVREGRPMRKGLALGAGTLLLIALFILLPIIHHMPVVDGRDLPMLALASAVSPALGVAFTAVLFAGIIASASACLFSFLDHVGERAFFRGGLRLPVFLAAAFAASLLGFRQLVGVAYPVFGYIGLIALAGIVRHYFRTRGLGSVHSEGENANAEL